MNIKPNALKLFRSGYDYIAIAAYFNTTEAEIEKTIHALRQRERLLDGWEERLRKKREYDKIYRASYYRKKRDMLLAERAKAAKKETPR